MQSYFNLEDIAHTMNIQKEQTARFESLLNELKKTKGKRLIKFTMNINVEKRYPHQITDRFQVNFV